MQKKKKKKSVMDEKIKAIRNNDRWELKKTIGLK